MIFNTTSATNKSRIFLFIFFSRCGILALEKSTPVGGCPLQGSLCIYFFFLDFLDFLCFISWRAVKVKTKISIKSFIISKASCMVSITFFSFLRLALYSFLLFSFHGFIIYLFRYIVNAFFSGNSQKNKRVRRPQTVHPQRPYSKSPFVVRLFCVLSLLKTA